MMGLADMDSIRHRLSRYSTDEQEVHASADHRQAAVLILLHPGPDNTPEILLTRRSKQLTNHAGQISFPGGTRDHTDESLVMTALREAEEEVGLPASAVDVLSRLPDVLLPSGFCVTPIVGVAEQLPRLSANPAEVEEIFTLPLSFLLRTELFERSTRVINGIKRDFYHFDYKDYYIWGATAAMLRNLALILE